MHHLILKILFLALIYDSSDSSKCKPRYYGEDKMVCVCNADYCDTIPHVTPMPRRTFVMFSSTKSGLRFERTEGKFQNAEFYTIYQIRIEEREKKQKVFGWGGAFSDATAVNIKSLNDKAQKKLMASYFSDDGIEYNYCRVPIGMTDFSEREYTYADVPNDMNLNHFELQYEDYFVRIPIIQEAIRLRKDMKLLASAWTPPIWMKTVERYSGVSFLKEEMFQVWADYHVKFLENYAESDIHFWGITTGNEPINAFIPFFPIAAVGWTPTNLSRWVSDNLGPTVRAKYPDMKIIALDDERIFLPWWADSYFKNEKVKQYTNGLAVHWYFDLVVSPEVLTQTHDKYPDMELQSTEASAGFMFIQPKVDLGSWGRAESYLGDIFENMENWVTSWVDWNMVLNLNGGPSYVNNFVDSPLIVNSTGQEFYKQPMFYAMGHFSKFVPRGSVFIKVINVNSIWNLKVIAFKRPDGAIAVVLHNLDNIDYKVTLKDPFRGIADINIEKKSVNTFLYW